MSGEAGWGWLASAVSLVSITLGHALSAALLQRDRLVSKVFVNTSLEDNVRSA